MAETSVTGTALGNALQDILMAPDLQPGDDVSYQTAKTIYLYHPLGAKIVDSPLAVAQSQDRKISIQKGPEDRLREAFEDEWKALGADRVIFNTARLARIYGVASLALLVEGTPNDRPVNFEALAGAKIGFNVLDPLNTAGSLVLDQNPASIDFLKVQGITIAGKPVHRSRAVTLMHEDPVYLSFTSTSFGYVGRSVYLRALFPLKSYINTLVTDDMVAYKAGLLVTKIKQTSSIVDGLMAAVGAVKRILLQQGATGNVLQIGHEDAIESLNLQNIDGAFKEARKNILENIASAAGTPAQIINSETMAEGFGEGTEDAKRIAQYIQRLRIWMTPLYDFMTKVCQYRAWNKQFYETLKADYKDKLPASYRQFFYDAQNSFAAEWPSLIEEPDSDKIAVSDVKLKAMIAVAEVLLPIADPENKANIVQWIADNINSDKLLFPSSLLIDVEALVSYEPPTQTMGEGLEEPKPGKPFAAQDSQRLREALRVLA